PRCYQDPAAMEENRLPGWGRAKSAFDGVEVKKAAEYAAGRADVPLRVWQVLKARLPADRVSSVYETLERPLIPVLARMERRGISIDRPVLSRLSGAFAPRAGALEARIPTPAREPLN